MRCQLHESGYHRSSSCSLHVGISPSYRWYDSSLVRAGKITTLLCCLHPKVSNVIPVIQYQPCDHCHSLCSMHTRISFIIPRIWHQSCESGDQRQYLCSVHTRISSIVPKIWHQSNESGTSTSLCVVYTLELAPSYQWYDTSLMRTENITSLRAVYMPKSAQLNLPDASLSSSLNTLGPHPRHNRGRVHAHWEHRVSGPSY